jgi:hypothetical protein
MRLWSIPNLKLVAENKKVYAACIYRVFSKNVTGEPILICGSASVTDGGVYLAKGPLLCAMKLPSLGVTRRVFAAGSGLVKFAVPLDVPGRTLVVVTYTYAGADGGVKVVDMDQRRVLGSSELMAEVFGTIQHSGSEFLVFGAYYGELHTLRIRIEGDSKSGNAEIELLPTSTAVKGGDWLGPVRFRDSDVLLCRDGDLVRAWDVANLLAAGSTQTLDLVVLAASDSASCKLCVVNAAGTATIYRASDGRVLLDISY